MKPKVLQIGRITIKIKAYFESKKKFLSFSYKYFFYICTAFKKRHGFVAQLDRASDYGSEGLGFESLQDHQEVHQLLMSLF